MTLLRSPIRSSIRSTLYNPLVGKWGGPYDASLFGPSDDGFLFNFSKLDRLFQDVAGTTAVAVDADPIALPLEGHAFGGKTLQQVIAGQPELVTNGDFSAGGTGWSAQSGWTVSVGAASVNSSAAGTTNLRFGSAVAGRFYRVTFTVTSVSGSGLRALAGTASDAGANVTSPGTYSRVVQASGSGGLGLVATLTNTIATVTFVSAKEIPGNHGSQSTTSARPFWKTPNFARFDGADDNLLTTFNAVAAGNSVALKMTAPASLAAAQIVAGLNGSSNGRFYLAINTSGQLCAGVGANSITSHVGTSDIRGQKGVAVLVEDGTNVLIYWNGARESLVARNGAPATTIPYRIGSNNANGTASNFAAIDVPNALAINRALTPAEIINLTNSWGTT